MSARRVCQASGTRQDTLMPYHARDERVSWRSKSIGGARKVSEPECMTVVYCVHAGS